MNLLLIGAGVAVLLIIILALVLHYMGSMLSELEHHFLPIAFIAFVFIIGLGVFLTYAVPILASDSTLLIKQSDGSTVVRDNPQGFEQPVE